MTIVQMLGQSGILTLLGMGIVFSFLIIMVISVTIMGKIVRAIGVDKELDQAGSQAQVPAKATAVTAAITAAVSEYQKDHS